jgi:exonuclease III
MLNTTFIFLSDLRLGGGHSDRDIKKNFECNRIKNYDFFHNSSKNKRGVGILIDKTLIYSVTAEYRDASENILGLKILTNDYSIWLISIYGPNHNDDTFFDNLQDLLRTVGDTPAVFGGDWNATVCTLNNADNIDILHMQSPPSLFRSQKIQVLQTEGKLTDPFRALWPEKRDFSYVPRNGRQNRSRLDFFLISDCILHHVSECGISESLNCSLFDHKSINLTLGSCSPSLSNAIFSSTINHSTFPYIVTTSITDTYLNHAVPETENLERFSLSLGNCLRLIG